MSAAEHRLAGIRAQDVKAQARMTAGHPERPCDGERVGLFPRRAPDAPAAQLLLSCFLGGLGERGEDVIAQRVPDAAVAVEAGDGDSTEAVQRDPLGGLRLEPGPVLLDA